MEAADEWITLREFARRLGVNVNAVQQALANGRVIRREEDKKFHWPTQSKSWEEFRDLSKVREDDDDDGPNVLAFQEAKTRKEIAIAGLKELELQTALGEMVRASHVRSAMAQFAIDVREAVMGIPDRVASELAAEVATASAGLDLEVARELVHRVWRRESRKALERIASAERRE